MKLHNSQFPKIFIYFSLLSIFTFIVFEIAISYLINVKDKKEKSEQKRYENKVLKYAHQPNLKKKFFRTIIANQKSLKKQPLEFKTDSIGSIIPSSFNNISTGDKYILFCGGSTTEASQVMMSKRPTDIYTKLTGIKALNLAKSGKTLNNCISTIKSFNHFIENSNSEISYPSKYVIATNINALMDFGRFKYKKYIINKNKNYFKSNLLKAISKIIKYQYRNYFFNINLSNYEQALLDGCCFGVSQINSTLLSPKTLNWDKHKIKVDYRRFIEKSFEVLNMHLKKNNLQKKDIVIAIEPNSFSISYDKIFQPYFKGKDSRQLLNSYNGKLLSFKKSNIILQEFNKIYIDVSKSNGYKVITQDLKSAPNFAFYDAVHTTDVGSLFIGRNYAENINIED